MRVLKFGGSSVANSERIKKVIEILRSASPCDVVVVSAAQGVTDALLFAVQGAASGSTAFRADLEALNERHKEIARGLISIKCQNDVLAKINALHVELMDLVQGAYLVRELSARTQDSVLAFGERILAYVMSEALKASDINAYYVDARKLVTTNSRYGNALVDNAKTYEKIVVARQDTKALLVVAGFIASSHNGDTTTLGRGGSDLSASLFGAALGADEIEIWTDVDGVMTADPRKVKEALRIVRMTYEEAMEMSHFGAKVIYPPTMMPAMERRIPIRIKNTLNPISEGTLIESVASAASHSVRGISSIDQIALMNVQGSGMVGVAGIAERLFKALAREHINVILISQASSEHSICVAIDPKASGRAEEAVNSEFALEISVGHIDYVKCDMDFSIVAIVGENMRNMAGISGRVFSALGKNGISVSAISQGSSERNISLVVQKSDVTKAVRCLHDAFFLGGAMTLNIYVVGVGLIGRELLSQMGKQRETLLSEHSVDLRVHGLSSSKKMLLSSEAIDLHQWADRLGESQESTNSADFVDQMIAANRPNSVFVDCTSSDTLINLYDDVLRASISVVTPNKKANSSSLTRFRNLRTLARAHSAKFIYEANVGAGLPVLSTLKNLLLSGDRILKIEAMLSGTLSFLFNQISKTKAFSAVVREAMSLGYTEPDPRDDLNGMDVARKLLILGREIGLPMGIEDITVEPVLALSDSSRESVEEWLIALEHYDGTFEAMRHAAETKHAALRFVATLSEGKGTARLIEVASDHPCYAAKGSDNVVSFTTQRYFERPLVIKGPGAGAAVTAAQVFADIVRVSNHLS